MDQQNGAPASAVTQAARTVLPGEPFDPPTSAQVPGPRQDERQPVPPPVPHWNYPPPEQAYGAPAYQDAPIAGMQFVDRAPAAARLPGGCRRPSPATSPHCTNTHPAGSAATGNATRPVRRRVSRRPRRASRLRNTRRARLNQPGRRRGPRRLPPPQQGQYAPGMIPQQDPLLPPLPPPPLDDDPNADGGHRRSGRRSIDKRAARRGRRRRGRRRRLPGLQPLRQVQLEHRVNPDRSGDRARGAQIRLPGQRCRIQAAAGRFSAQRRPASLTELKIQFVAAAAASLVSCRQLQPRAPGDLRHDVPPGPASSHDLQSSWRLSAKPGQGQRRGRLPQRRPGAAGGTMICGGRAVPNASWCVWHNTTTVGITVIEGSPKTADHRDRHPRDAGVRRALNRVGKPSPSRITCGG